MMSSSTRRSYDASVAIKFYFRVNLLVAFTFAIDPEIREAWNILTINLHACNANLSK